MESVKYRLVDRTQRGFPAGDWVLVTVRRGETNQEGETRDVGFVEGVSRGDARGRRVPGV